MKYLKINNKSVEVPTSYDELAWGKMKAIWNLDSEDPNYSVRILEIVLGLEPNEIDAATEIQNINLAVESVKFLSNMDIINTDKSVIYNGVKVELDSSLLNIPFILYQDLEALASRDEEKMPLSAKFTLMAQCYLSWKSNIAKIEELYEKGEITMPDKLARIKYSYQSQREMYNRSYFSSRSLASISRAFRQH